MHPAPLGAPPRRDRPAGADRDRGDGRQLTLDRQPIVAIEDPCSDRARRLLDAYLQDVISRFYGRRATPAELALARADARAEDLAEPRGVLLIARLDDRDLGCVGLRFLGGGIGEVTSLFVAQCARRQGIGVLLLDEVEAIAIDRGLDKVRLDTRHDLVEARRLYSRHGYREVAAFNEEPYAERWFEKELRSP